MLRWRRRCVLLVWDLHIASRRVSYTIIISWDGNRYYLRFSHRGIFGSSHSLPLWNLSSIWSLVFIVTVSPLLLAHSKLMLWLLLLEFEVLLILLVESLMKLWDRFNSTIDLRRATIYYVVYVYSLLYESSTMWYIAGIWIDNGWSLVTPLQYLHLLGAWHFYHFFNDKVFLFKGVSTVEKLLIINHLYFLRRPIHH